MKNIINFTGVLTSLFLSLPSFAQYAPNVDVTFQTANNSNYNQALTSTGLSIPIWQNVNSTIFSDLRISNNNDNMQGVHLGIGLRKEVANTTIGINGFYDIYNNKQNLSQFVTGVEILNSNVEIRTNFYKPNNNYFIYGGIEGELALKFKRFFLALKQYHFFNDLDSKVDGSGVKVKYESNKLGKSNFYLSAGYQYDNLLEHQFSTDFGVSIALSSTSREKSVNRLKRVERNMNLYGYRPEFANYTVINARDNISNIINKAPEGTTFIIRENQKLTDTLVLKDGQNLYNKYNYSPFMKKSDTPKKVKLEFAEKTSEEMIVLAESVHIKGLYLDGSNIGGSYSVIINRNNSNKINIEDNSIKAIHSAIDMYNTSNSIINNNKIYSSRYGIRFAQSSHNTITNNTLNTGYHSLVFRAKTRDLVIMDNIIHSKTNALYFNTGVSSVNLTVKGNNMKIDNNSKYSKRDAMYWADKVIDSKIEYNTINVTTHSTPYETGGINFKNGSENTEIIRNNITMIGNYQAVIILRDDNSNLKILNNTMTMKGNTIVAFKVYPGTENLTINGNYIYIKDIDEVSSSTGNQVMKLFDRATYSFENGKSTDNYVILESATPDGQDVNTDDIQNLVCDISNNAIVTGKVEFLVTENSGNSNEITRYLCPKSN